MHPIDLQILPFEISIAIDNLKLSVTTTPMKLTEESNIQHDTTSWYLIDAITSETVSNNLYSKSLTVWEDVALEPNKEYKIRVIYNTTDETLSSKMVEKSFKSPVVEIKQPDFEIDMDPKNTRVSIALSEGFQIFNSDEQHLSTTYIIRSVDGTVLYEKYKDEENLTSFNATEYLKSNGKYFIEVMVHTLNYDSARKIKYIKIPQFTEGEPFEIALTVNNNNNLLPTIRGMFHTEEDAIIKQVNLKIARRGYPKENIALFNKFLKQYEGKRSSEVGSTIEHTLTEEEMRSIANLKLEDKMGLWVHPWIFTLEIWFTNGIKIESRPIYKRFPLRANTGIIQRIRDDIPTFKLANAQLGATWDSVESITWIVTNAYGEQVVRETRSSLDQTFSLEPYVLKGEIVKGMFYYIQTLLTTKAGVSILGKTGNERDHRSDRKGVPFVIDNLKIKEPYIRITKIETKNQDLFDVHLKLSRFEVNHNPFGIDIEHTKTSIRVFDITHTSSNSNIQEKLVLEADLEPTRTLTLSKSKTFAPDFSMDPTNVGLYYNREYRIEVHYFGDNGMKSHVGTEVFKTPTVPVTKINSPIVQEAYMIPTGDIHLIVANLNKDLVRIDNNTEDSIMATVFKLYHGTELIYSKESTYDKYQFAIKDFDNGLLARLAPNTEYWLDIEYKTQYGVFSPVTSIRYIVGENPNKDFKIVNTFINATEANFRFLNLYEDAKYILTFRDQRIEKALDNHILTLKDLTPKTEYKLEIVGENIHDEITFTTQATYYYSNEELLDLNSKWELEYDRNFKGNYLRTFINNSLVHYKVYDNILLDLITMKRVSVHLSESNSYPIYDKIITTGIKDGESILEDIESLNFFTKEKFFIKVQLGISKQLWLPEKVLEFTVEEFDKVKCFSHFLWDKDDYEYLDKPILDSVDDKTNVMYPDSNLAKDRVMKLCLTVPKQFMEYIDYIGAYYNVNYGPYSVGYYQEAHKPMPNYKGESLFFLLPYNDNILYTDYRDLTTSISMKPENVVPIIKFKDGTTLSF